MESKYENEEYEDHFEDEKVDEQAWKSIAFQEIEIGKQIGGGGVGLIYEGKYKGNPVALKTLFDPRVDDDLKQEYMDELLIMSRLDHPNIVRCIGACMEAPNLCVVMELCQCSLYDLLHQSSTELPTHRIIEMAQDIAAALNYLHNLKPAIIHRDIKSHNVLIGDDGSLKLCDFGLVRTKTTTAGTPCYMPPELLQNRPFSKAVDVYMFGMLLWEMFERMLPFHGYDAYDIKQKVVAGERPKIPTVDCPRQCQDLIKRCWDSNEQVRPSFSTIVKELDTIAKTVPTQSHVTTCLDAYGGDALDDLLN